MQRVTNMELLKLSYWNAAKDMLNVLIEIKDFLQQWARLEVNSERNDKIRFPNGSYVDIEHHLLRLALVRMLYILMNYDRLEIHVVRSSTVCNSRCLFTVKPMVDTNHVISYNN